MKPNSRHKGKVHRRQRERRAVGNAETSQGASAGEEISPVAADAAAKEASRGCGHDHDHGHGHAHSHSHDGDCCHGHGHCHAEEEHHHAGAGAAAAVAAGESEWTRRFFLFLELGVLSIWGLVMVWFYASGRIEKYLVGEGLFRIQVLIAGLALFVIGMFNWLMRAQNAGCGHDHSHDGDGCGHDHEHDHAPAAAGDGCSSCCGGHAHDDHGHEHHHHHHGGSTGGRSLALALLAMSVTAAAAWTADDFSDDYKKKMLAAESGRGAPQGETPEQYRIAPEAAEQAVAAGGGGVTLELIEKYQKRNERGNFELDVMQLYYSGSDAEYAKVMTGQGVETIGQVVHDPAAGGDPRKLRVFVLQVSCCAADARPFSIPVEITGPNVPQVQDMGWYRIAGKLDYIQERGVMTALLKAEDIQPAVRPRSQRMLF